MILGITGSFGSGKTTVANLFKKHGFEVISVDKLYRDIYKKNKPLKNKIKKEFETVNRDKLKKIVFNNSNKLKKLNRITHPIIINNIKNLIKKNKNAKIVIDAPLLIEAKATNLVNNVIVVKCNEKIQIRRLLKKKKYTKEEIKNIIKSQMPLKEKLKYAAFAIDNNKGISHLENQVKDIVEKLNIVK